MFEQYGADALRFTLARPDLVRSLILMDTSGWSFRPTDPLMDQLMSGFLAAFDPAGGLPDLTAMRNAEDDLIEARTPADWLDDQLATFDKVYGGKRPKYLDGYTQLKAAIKPWGTK